MSDKTTTEDVQKQDKPAELSESEASGVVGGHTFTQEQYDRWERQGAVEREGDGTGGGE